MENLILKQTDDTPEINFGTDGCLKLTGISIPENVINFYTPVINWIKDLENNTPSEISLIFEIEYINTSSTRAFIDLIKKVVSLDKNDCQIRIVWRYREEDHDNLELGKDLEYSSKSIFVFEPIPNNY